MCFDYDCEWTASVSDEDDAAVSDRPVRCDECYATIPAGTPYRHLYQQEHDETEWDEEEAMALAWDDLEDGFVGPPEPPRFDPGETFDYDCCHACVKLRQAVRASELEAGCAHHEAEPPLPLLFEAVWESGCAARYAAKARAMFPELEGTPAFAKLLRYAEEQADA